MQRSGGTKKGASDVGRREARRDDWWQQEPIACEGGALLDISERGKWKVGVAGAKSEAGRVEEGEGIEAKIGVKVGQ